MSTDKIGCTHVVGILGGMGPAAGLDLASKVVSETRAAGDQDHIPMLLLSMPAGIPDRTEFLLGNTDVNPGIEISSLLITLAEAGATVAGIACNTAHAPPIYDEVVRLLETAGTALRPLHLIKETVDSIGIRWPHVRRVGILGTPGTLRFRLYDEPLAAAGFDPIQPASSVADGPLRAAIYDPEWGIKAQSTPVTPRARQAVRDSIEHLVSAGAEVIILGCTELPLAAQGASFTDLPLVDPSRVLARALVRCACPDRLMPESIAGC